MRRIFPDHEDAAAAGPLARREFPDGKAIGKRVKCGLDRNDWMTVIGVVGMCRASARSPQAVGGVEPERC